MVLFTLLTCKRILQVQTQISTLDVLVSFHKLLLCFWFLSQTFFSDCISLISGKGFVHTHTFKVRSSWFNSCVCMFHSCRERNNEILCLDSRTECRRRHVSVKENNQQIFLLMNCRVFVNRSLHLEKIKFFGFDMDYTLAGKSFT